MTARTRGGDREAYDLIVRALTPEMYRVAVAHVRNPDAAEDIVQMAFVRAYERIDAVHGRFDAWLYRIVQNVARDHLRGQQTRAHERYHVDLAESAAPTPDREIERSELGQHLDRAIDALPPGLRAAFLLRHVEGLEYREIATHLATTVAAVKMRVHRAREVLQDQLAPLFADHLTH